MFPSPFVRSFLFEQAADPAGGAGGGTGGGAADAPPPAATAFDFRTLANEKGEFVEGWQDKLPTEYDPHRATLANYRSFDKVAEALVESKRAAMAKTEGMIRLPGKDAKPEEIAEYRKALGIPEKPEDYGLKAPEKLPEGTEWDEGFAKSFSTKAHELGLSKAQVEALSAWHMQETVQKVQGIDVEGTKIFEAQQAELRRDFGEHFDKRMVDAQRAAMTLGLPADHPVFFRADTIKAMAKLSDLISEDKLVSPSQVANKLSPDTAARDVMTNPDNPDYKAYYDPSHGRHKEVVAHVNAQMQRAFPGGR